MSDSFFGWARGCSNAALLTLLVFAGASLRAQKVDLNTNGESDVWEQIYGATGLNPDADTDGDGVNNRLEAIAGTDPFDAQSVPMVSPLVLQPASAQVSIGSALGKKYQLQSVDMVCSP